MSICWVVVANHAVPTCILVAKVRNAAVEVQPLLGGEGELAAGVRALVLVGHVRVEVTIVLVLCCKLGTTI